MVRNRKAGRLAAALTLAAALGAGACSSGGDGADGSLNESTGAAPDTGAGPETSGPAAGSGGTISYGITEPAAIDPGLMQEVEGLQATRLLFEGLTGLDENLNVVPGVAETWEVGADKLTWTFHLRPSTFSNGEKVTAASFVTAFARSADPDLASPVAYQGSPIAGWDEVMGGDASGKIGDEPVSGVTAVDDATLQIVTASPFSLLPKVLTHTVFSPVPADTVAGGAASFTDEPIGNGPYVLDGPWEHNVGIDLVRSEGYVGDRPAGPDRIELRIFDDFETMYREVQAGTLDITRVGHDLLPDARTQFPDAFAEFDLAALNYIGFPANVAPFDNPDIRRALSLAIDRQAVARVDNDATEPAEGFVPDIAPGAAAGTCPYCTYDPQQAKALFDKAGGIPGNKIVFYDIAGDGGDARLEAIINGWKTVLGVDTEVRTFDFAQLIEETAPGKAQGPFELGWVWDYPSAYSIVQPLFESTSGANNLSWESTELDALMEQARTSADEQAAIGPIKEAQTIVGDEVPLAPVSFGRDAIVHTARVDNVVEDAAAAFHLELVTAKG